MITAKTELRVLKSMVVFPTIREALSAIDSTNFRLLSRRAPFTTAKLEREIYLVELRKCQIILKELA